jgi:hypothetical protein
MAGLDRELLDGHNLRSGASWGSGTLGRGYVSPFKVVPWDAKNLSDPGAPASETPAIYEVRTVPRSTGTVRRRNAGRIGKTEAQFLVLGWPARPILSMCRSGREGLGARTSDLRADHTSRASSRRVRPLPPRRCEGVT